jgi:hypothetical protein
MIFEGPRGSPNVRAQTRAPAGWASNVCLMEFITIFFIAMVLGTIVLAPRIGAESRQAFVRPDRCTPARLWDWDRR